MTYSAFDHPDNFADTMPRMHCATCGKPMPLVGGFHVCNCWFETGQVGIRITGSANENATWPAGKPDHYPTIENGQRKWVKPRWRSDVPHGFWLVLGFVAGACTVGVIVLFGIWRKWPWMWT